MPKDKSFNDIIEKTSNGNNNQKSRKFYFF